MAKQLNPSRSSSPLASVPGGQMSGKPRILRAPPELFRDTSVRRVQNMGQEQAQNRGQGSKLSGVWNWAKSFLPKSAQAKPNFETGYSSMTEPQKLRVLGSVAKILNDRYMKGEMRAENLSPENILMAENQPVRLAEISESKPVVDKYKDVFSRNSRMTPFGDVYALAVMALDTLELSPMMNKWAQGVLDSNQIIENKYKDYENMDLVQVAEKFPAYSRFMEQLLAVSE